MVAKRTSAVNPVPPIIAIAGPNASGKSALAISLAKKFNGEVVSADSRQVYQGLDIGSGKVSKKEMRGVRHHLLDVANTSRTFTVAQYQRLARRAVADIWRRHKLPILCGGTGFYIDAVLQGTDFPHVKPNAKLRKVLDKKTTIQLLKLLKHKDPARTKAIDPHNRHRILRALEIVSDLGQVPHVKINPLVARVLIIGIKKDPAELKHLIKLRLRRRLRLGLVAEVRRLHARGLSWKRLESFGLEYRAGARYLQDKLTKKELEQTILKESWQYARRQMTWFRKTPNVHWVSSSSTAQKLVGKFAK